MNFDFWYGNTLSEITNATVTFYPNESVYRGNMYINGKCVGDFSSKDSVKIEKIFPGIFKED